jgi:5-methylcytosine-specific restriction endonuclease McrA
MSLQTPEAKATLDRIEAECNALGLELPSVTGRHECSPSRYNYLARIYNIEGQVTAEEWESLKERYGYQCLCCHTGDIVLVPDFIISWSNKGTNTIENVQPLCPKCNKLKGRRQYDYRIQWLTEEVRDIEDRTKVGSEADMVQLELGL